MSYGLSNAVIGDMLTHTNLTDRKWLDNNFYGSTLVLNYQPMDSKLQATVGGAWNR